MLSLAPWVDLAARTLDTLVPSRMTAIPSSLPAWLSALTRPFWIAAALLLGLGASLRAWLCFHDDGIYWPDEIFQSLEPAHRLVFGYGLIPWEFRDGARNWTFPGLVAAILRLVTFVTGNQPLRYLVAIRLVFVLVGLATAFGIYRLAKSYDARPVGAALAAVLFALSSPAIYFSPRALSETASALPLVFGLALVLRRNPPRPTLAVGTSLLGLSVLLRIQNAFFCAGVLGVLLARRRWRDAALAAVTLAGWAFLYGLIDRLTWGDWFHAAIAYLRANVIENKGAQWGVSEWSYYFRVFWTSSPIGAVLVAVPALFAVRKAPGLVSIIVLNLIALSQVEHKEYRFLLTSFPALFAIAGIGVSELIGRVERLGGQAWWVAAPMASAAVVPALGFHSLTFGDLGAYEHEKPQVSAYDDSGPINRLLLVAHDQNDICGLMMAAIHPAWAGGATYLHRNVPMYWRGDGDVSSHYNYVVTGGRAPGQVIASEGPFTLVRTRATCAADPGFRWWLP